MGLALIQTVMEEEVRRLPAQTPPATRRCRVHCWAKENGYRVVDGRKVAIRKKRLRRPDKRGQRLGSYELFQRSGPLQKRGV